MDTRRYCKYYCYLMLFLSFFDYLNKTAAAFFGYLRIKTRIKLKRIYEYSD